MQKFAMKFLCSSPFVVIWFLCIFSTALDNQQLMVCKPISSLFETNVQSNNTNSFQFPAAKQDCRSSRPGKQGPRGLRGPPGPSGSPGKAANLSEGMMNLLAEIQLLKQKFQCIDGVLVGNTCYKLIYRAGKGMNYESAQNLCAFQGMGLAEIPTEEAYNATYNYVQKNWYIHFDHPSHQYVQIWLGSSYNSRGNVILTSGQKGYVLWLSSYPRATAGHTRMAVEVITRPGHQHFGFFNINSGHSRPVPLCQFEIA